MSNKRYDFWVHGVNTIVEYPEHARIIRHAGWGTLVEQDADPPGRNNWFHLPIPTPTIIKGDHGALDWLALKVWMNENVRIAQIHVRMGDLKIIDESPGWVGQDRDTEERISFNGDSVLYTNAAINLCTKVEFLSGTPRGRIIFRGAGAVFKRSRD